MAYTPGPWKAHGLLVVAGADDKVIVKTYYSNYSTDEALGNAQLIAAALELLEALQQVNEWGDDWREVIGLEARVRALIARIEEA